MKLVKVLLITWAVLAFLGILVWQVWLKDLVAFADVSAAYGAKMVCSCIHVAERPLDSCKTDFTADVSAVTFTDDGQVTRASVLNGLIRTEARYEPGLGCTLVKR